MVQQVVADYEQSEQELVANREGGNLHLDGARPDASLNARHKADWRVAYADWGWLMPSVCAVPCCWSCPVQLAPDASAADCCSTAPSRDGFCVQPAPGSRVAFTRKSRAHAHSSTCCVADTCVASAEGLQQDVMLSSRAHAVHKVDAHLRAKYGGVRKYCLAAGCAPCWAYRPVLLAQACVQAAPDSLFRSWLSCWHTLPSELRGITAARDGAPPDGCASTSSICHVGHSQHGMAAACDRACQSTAWHTLEGVQGPVPDGWHDWTRPCCLRIVGYKVRQMRW